MFCKSEFKCLHSYKTNEACYCYMKNKIVSASNRIALLR